MPNPTWGAGLLRPTFQGLPALRGLSGMGQLQHPSEEMILQSQQELTQDQPLWMDILDIPDRIFGGQMIKGLLAGSGEEGIGDNLEMMVRNNPLFQLMEAVPGLNELKDAIFGDVQTIRATDVRQAFGANADTVGEDWLLNLGMEIILDPSSFMFMGARVPGLAAKGLGTSAQTLKKGVQGGALNRWLIQAERGQLPARGFLGAGPRIGCCRRCESPA